MAVILVVEKNALFRLYSAKKVVNGHATLVFPNFGNQDGEAVSTRSWGVIRLVSRSL